MNIDHGSEAETFRDEIRAFLQDGVPPNVKEKLELRQLSGSEPSYSNLTKDEYLDWHRALYKKGWVAPHWPINHGGLGWTPLQRHVYEEELGLAGVPRILPFGPTMVGPVIMEFGSDQQKEHFLPRILSGEDMWCQGYSEPSSGSDLASLKTRAVRDGNDYIVNGSKIWTTSAHWADMIFCLVRTDTDVKKQEGISFLLINMHDPGIEVRPIITLDGGHEINQVFFDDVRIPIENVVGEIDRGWDIVVTTLSVERGSSSQHARLEADLDLLIEATKRAPRAHGTAADDPQVRQRVAGFAAEMMVMRMSAYRNAWRISQEGLPGPEGSTLKVFWSELDQRLKKAAVEILGPRAMVPEGDPLALDDGYWAYESLWSRAATIYAGTSEVQRNIIANRVLGLPR